MAVGPDQGLCRPVVSEMSSVLMAGYSVIRSLWFRVSVSACGAEITDTWGLLGTASREDENKSVAGVISSKS